MDDRLQITLLLDFYGSLLTEKQYDMLDLHYNNDYSLAEIANEYNITRQGAFDNIKRGRATLFELENKLGLVDKFTKQKKVAKKALLYLENINTNKLDDDSIKNLEKVRNEILRLSE